MNVRNALVLWCSNNWVDRWKRESVHNFLDQWWHLRGVVIMLLITDNTNVDSRTRSVVKYVNNNIMSTSITGQRKVATYLHLMCELLYKIDWPSRRRLCIGISCTYRHLVLTLLIFCDWVDSESVGLWELYWVKSESVGLWESDWHWDPPSTFLWLVPLGQIQIWSWQHIFFCVTWPSAYSCHCICTHTILEMIPVYFFSYCDWSQLLVIFYFHSVFI